MKKLLFISLIIVLTVTQSCVKTTVNLDKISDRFSLEPSYVIAAVKGDVNLGDIVEPNDTVFFDDLGLMKIVFSEDSIINYGVSDFYSSFADGTFTELFPVPPTTDVVLDTLLDLAPGDGIKIKEMSVITGKVDYTISSTCTYNTNLTIQFPTIDDGGTPLTESIPLNALQDLSGQIDIAGVVADFTGDAEQPYNRLPMIFTITPSGTISDTPGNVNVEVLLSEPEYDYIVGYFGQQSELSDSETLETGLEDLTGKISGDFELSNPIITVNYSNSFGIPLRVNINAAGRKPGENDVSLDRAPEDLLYPGSVTGQRDVEGSFVINKTNSEIVSLVSMLPEEIIFSGSATSNPDGESSTDNIIFGDSRFMADIEVEVPMEFSINNLQLKDTVDNFFLAEDGEESLLDMLSDLELRMHIDNGFPLGGSITLELFDSIAGTPLSSISTDTFFDPAEVDANGRVTTSTEKSTVIEMTEAFIDDASVADKIIITFTLFTSGNGSQVVKLYSDYSINFNAGVAFKASLN